MRSNVRSNKYSNSSIGVPSSMKIQHHLILLLDLLLQCCNVIEETQIIVYWVKRVRTEGADVFSSSPLAANVSPPLCYGKWKSLIGSHWLIDTVEKGQFYFNLMPSPTNKAQSFNLVNYLVHTVPIFSHNGVILRPNDFLKNVQQRCQLVTRDADAANILASRVGKIHQIQHIVTIIGELIDPEFDLKTPKPSENLEIHRSLI